MQNFALILREQSNRLSGDSRIVGERLQRGDDAVASEKSDEPGNAGGKIGNILTELVAQHAQVAQRSIQNAIQRQTVCLDPSGFQAVFVRNLTMGGRNRRL